MQGFRCLPRTQDFGTILPVTIMVERGFLAQDLLRIMMTHEEEEMKVEQMPGYLHPVLHRFHSSTEL